MQVKENLGGAESDHSRPFRLTFFLLKVNGTLVTTFSNSLFVCETLIISTNVSPTQLLVVHNQRTIELAQKRQD